MLRQTVKVEEFEGSGLTMDHKKKKKEKKKKKKTPVEIAERGQGGHSRQKV